MKTSRKKSKRRFRKLKKVAKRLAAYSAAAAATLMTTQNRSANAGEVVHDILDVTVGPTSSEQVVFDMVAGTTQGIFLNGAGHQTQGVMRLMGYYVGYPSPFFYAPFSASTVPSAFVGTGTSNAATLGPGATIGAADNFVRYHNPSFSGYGYYANLGNWSVGQRAFVGIRFALPTGTHFGWAEVTRDDTKVVTLHGFGYDDTPDAASHPVNTVDPPPIPTLLTLEVNTVTGALTMLGDPSNAIDINFYEITSPGNSLDATNWSSLADQDFEGDYDRNGTIDGSDFLKWQIDGGTPAQLAEWEAHYGNSGPGSGWEESAGIGTHVLAEGFLLGASTIAAAASISLGMGYDQSVDAQDLMFEYRTDTGAFVEGLVVYETGIPGDFDGNGGVDGSDFLLWQRDPSVGSLADWKTNYGMGTAPILAASAAVPEPSSIWLLAAGAAGLEMWRRRKQV